MPSPVFQRILLFLNPEFGMSVDKVYRISRMYARLTERSALVMIAAWRGSTLAATRAKYRPALYDDERHRAARRRTNAARGAAGERAVGAYGDPGIGTLGRARLQFLTLRLRKHPLRRRPCRHHRQQRRRSADLLDGDGHEIPIENGEVGELAVFERAAPRLVEREPRTADLYRRRASSRLGVCPGRASTVRRRSCRRASIAAQRTDCRMRPDAHPCRLRHGRLCATP